MSDLVKLSTRLPGETDINGVDALAAELVKDPETIRVAVLWFDVTKVTHDTDTGDDVPTIRVRRLEPIGDVDTIPDSIRHVVDVATEKRTGRAALPFDLVDVVDVEIVE
jgi:hypothetical protein